MLAWQIVNIYWVSRSKKKMPDPKRLLRGPRRNAKTPDGPAQMTAHRVALQMLSAQYGIPLRKAAKH